MLKKSNPLGDMYLVLVYIQEILISAPFFYYSINVKNIKIPTNNKFNIYYNIIWDLIINLHMNLNK